MHSIERYGIVALLFLVVTVVAVLMWDGGKEKKKAGLAGTAVAPAAPRQQRPGAEERRAQRRLELAAEPVPGPLSRQAQPGGDVAAPLAPAAGAETPSMAPGAEVSSPAASQKLTPPEQPARDPVVGQAPPSAARDYRDYKVRPGDTLSEISQRELGSARRWQEILAANPGLEPARLRSGKTIRIPGAKPATAVRAEPGPSKPEAAPAAAGTRTWKVGKGENLWRIAERALGDGKRWPEIAALNPRVNPDRLVLGQVLTLPAATSGKPASTPKKPASPLVASAGGERLAPRGGKVR